MAPVPALKASARGVARGFTLLELLLALFITTMVVALAYAMLGVIGRTQQRTTAEMQRTEQILAAQRWLRGQLQGMRQFQRLEQGAVQLFFSGNAAGALWVSATASPEPGAALRVVRVALQRHADGRVDWVAQRIPFAGAQAALDWSQAEEAVLARGLRTLQWRYLDGLTGSWVQDWPADRPFYPARIRIEVADDRGPWPPFTVALPRAR